MRAFVTGATGFIGRRLVERLTRARYPVRAFLRESSDAGTLDSSAVDIVRGDIRNLHDVERAVEGCGLVFHLAVVRRDRSVTVDGAATVARAALRAKAARMVFTSTTNVYGRTSSPSIDEDVPIRPEPGHGEYKAEAERLLLELRASDGLPVVIARLPGVLGPGMDWGGMFAAIASGRFRMIGPGTNRDQPVDVSDAVEGLFLCGTVSGIEGRTYILAGQAPRTLREIVHCIEQEAGVKTSRSVIPAGALRAYAALDALVGACGGGRLPRHDRMSLFLRDRGFNLSRARQELGYSPKVPLEETVRRAVAWYRGSQLRSKRELAPAAARSED